MWPETVCVLCKDKVLDVIYGRKEVSSGVLKKKKKKKKKKIIFVWVCGWVSMSTSSVKKKKKKGMKKEETDEYMPLGHFL